MQRIARSKEHATMFRLFFALPKWALLVVLLLSLGGLALPLSPAVAAAERVARAKKWSRKRPLKVIYRIQRGGSLRNVANLYKIHHYEIAKLNPGISLDKRLGRGSQVVVYRASQSRRSASVGYPDRGSIVGAVPMLDGPGRSLRAIPWKRWATAHTVWTLDRVLRRWHRVEPSYPLLVGNLSDRDGGRLRPHQSHRSGRDVDLGFVQKKGLYKAYGWRVMSARNLDVRRTWNFLKLLLSSGQVERIFMDRSLQRLIYRYARRHPGKYRARLKRWFSVAGGRGKAVIQHARGHRDHMHVRLRCPRGDRRCRTRNS